MTSRTGASRRSSSRRTRPAATSSPASARAKQPIRSKKSARNSARPCPSSTPSRSRTAQSSRHNPLQSKDAPESLRSGASSITELERIILLQTTTFTEPEPSPNRIDQEQHPITVVLQFVTNHHSSPPHHSPLCNNGESNRLSCRFRQKEIPRWPPQAATKPYFPPPLQESNRSS